MKISIRSQPLYTSFLENRTFYLRIIFVSYNTREKTSMRIYGEYIQLTSPSMNYSVKKYLYVHMTENVLLQSWGLEVYLRGRVFAELA